MKAVLGWGAAVGILVWVLSTLGSVASNLLGLPPTLGLPSFVSAVGWGLVAGGAGVSLWLFKHRHPLDMVISTYFTFVKMFTRSPVSKIERRTEPLVVSGPQRYVRNPLYLGALMSFLGWDLVTSVTASLVGLLFILAWFRFVQIPFEERELGALFGESYADYQRQVPMLFPHRRPFEEGRSRQGRASP